MKTKIKKRYIALILIAIFITLFIVNGLDYELKTVYYTIESEKINSNIRICYISDLHSTQYGEGQSDLIARISSEKSDIVILGGDIFDDKVEGDDTNVLLKKLGNEYPCFYVTGNHEFWSDDTDELLDIFIRNNIKILRGEYETLKINDDLINIFNESEYNINKISHTYQIGAKEINRNEIIECLVSKKDK